MKQISNQRKANSVDPRDRHSMQVKNSNYPAGALYGSSKPETDREWQHDVSGSHSKKNSTQQLNQQKQASFSGQAYVDRDTAELMHRAAQSSQGYIV